MSDAPRTGHVTERHAGAGGGPPMPRWIRAYVRVVERVSGVVGRITMLLIFVMVAVLFWSVITKSFFTPSIWTLEIAQFLMVAYFLLGGAWAIRDHEHVRMDLLYGQWRPRRQAGVDAVTVLFMIFYLFWLLVGGVSSLTYAVEYGERSFSLWRPHMWPIKLVMVIGILLTLLQAVATMFRNYAEARGRAI